MFIANLLIALREGFEATLVVGILVAYLVKADRRDVLPKLWTGIGLAALVPLAVGAVLTWGPRTLTFQAQEIIGGVLSLVAVALVTSMIFWMGRNARAMKHQLETSLQGSLDRNSSGWGVVWIAVLAVGREGVETALFIWATVRSSIEHNVFLTTAGVVTGLALAVVLGWLVFRGARRINMHRFFAWTGYFLIFVVAGIAAYGVGDLQEAGVLPGVFHHAWDFSAWLPEATSPVYWLYVLAQAMFQFNLQPTVLQVIAWWVYLVPVLFLFARQVHASGPPAARTAGAGAPSSSGSASPAASGASHPHPSQRTS